jgi:hypothetical protein
LPDVVYVMPPPPARIVDATSTVDHSPEPKRLVVTDDAYLP